MSESIHERPELAEYHQKRAYVMRLATAYLVVPHDASDTVAYAERIVSALQEDPRVTSATVPVLDPGWSPQYTAYLPIDRDDREHGTSGVLEGTRHVHVQKFSGPIGITLRVPAKNQPKVFEDDDIPTEHYFVLWDGEALLVGWEQSGDDYVGSSGGHVIEEILKQAADRVDAGVIVQACNPQCTYVFLHTAIRVVVDPTAATDWAIARHTEDSLLMDLVVSGGDSVVEVSLSVWLRVRLCLRPFASMKNRGRQILELERVVRGDLDHLNRLYHQRASAAQEGRITRLRAVWVHRKWRRTSRYYLARLWLGLGSLERLRREWVDDALSFRRATEEDKLHDLFTVDTYDEVALVEGLGLGLVESAVEHAGDRLSASFLAIATAGGAVAGAVAAAVVTVV